ncbi:hypothetical protein TNCV_782541 [Trichonephila clavipes]|nr:hypothetical protein TNCV_782541 [Trichonephila clavipes]
MYAWRPLCRDYLTILAISEYSKSGMPMIAAPPKVLFALSVVMGNFTDSDKAYMHLIKGSINENDWEAPRLYQKRFPSRPIPSPKMFTSTVM